MKFRPLYIALFALFLASCQDTSTQKTTKTERSDVWQKLGSLGYVNIVPVADKDKLKVGVTKHDRTLSYDGFNLFNSREQSYAKLITMDGREVHHWSSNIKGLTCERFSEMLPSYVPFYFEGWNHIEMVENGDLLVIGSHHMLIRMNWNSTIKWKLNIAAHHDLSVSKNGDIYVLVDGISMAEVNGEPIAFQNNYVVIVTKDGQIKRKISLFDAFSDDPWRQELKQRLSAIKPEPETRISELCYDKLVGKNEKEKAIRLYNRAIKGDIGDDEGIMNILFHNQKEDIFHSNSIQVLERSVPGLWREGDILVCICFLDTIAVIDHESNHVIWSWGKEHLQRPHHATYLPDGNILIFDNGAFRNYSRIIKLSPKSLKIVWEYKADPPESFFSMTRGGCQELPNGNILITETNKGRAFEVTPQGKIVWEYYNEIFNKGGIERNRGAIYRMTRLDLPAVESLLNRHKPSATSVIK